MSVKISDKLINQFKEALSSEGLRFTEQRLAVLEDILKSNSHRDCDKIYSSLHSSGNKVSRATIYRTLDVLIDYGFIRKLDMW